MVCGALASHTAYADAPVKKVTGQYTFYGDKNDSPAMAKQKALEGARLRAIESEFGTIVSQDIMQADRINGNSEQNKFFALSQTEVAGEWIADDGQPVYVVSLDPDHNLVVNCTVKGSARALNNESAQFEAVALRLGDTKAHAATEFHNGEELKLYFSAPTDGTLAIFLLDEKGEVLKLLPYLGDSRNEVKVKKNYDYIIFDDSKAPSPEMGDPWGFTVTVDGGVEFNKLYVVFSPNAFTTPLMNRPDETAHPVAWLQEDKFAQWLVKARRNDPKMGVKQINLRLVP